jgi:hypothetical protein
VGCHADKPITRDINEETMIPSLRSLLVLAVLAEWGVAQSTGTPFCFPNTPGVMNCPCNNPPWGPGFMGCNNYGDWFGGPTGGAELFGAGRSSISHDTLQFDTSWENPLTYTVLLESINSSPSGTIYGAGICCLSSPIHLVYGHNGIRQIEPLEGSTLWGWPSDPPISGDIGAMSGQTTCFQALYRDPYAFTYCQNPNSTFNLTNAVSVTWVP